MGNVTEMGILSYFEIGEAIEAGYIRNVEYGSQINASSLDLTLGSKVLIEQHPKHSAFHEPLNLATREGMSVTEVDITNGFVLFPGMFILAQTRETFFLPRFLSGDYKLKSSMARIGLQHLNAGWCDAGWEGSVLTLELKNVTKYHSIFIKPGDRIGQMVFHRHLTVPKHASYSVRGAYNNDSTVSGAKPPKGA